MERAILHIKKKKAKVLSFLALLVQKLVLSLLALLVQKLAAARGSERAIPSSICIAVWAHA
jgi:hypothetical protein